MITIMLISLIGLLLSIVFFIKNDSTYANYLIIYEAIRDYHEEIGAMPREVSYRDMKSYRHTLFCFWDWSYKNILPEDKYEILKPYIYEVIERRARH